MNSCELCGVGIDDSNDICESCNSDLDERERNGECEFCCRPITAHSFNCPENESTYAQLIQKGYC